MLRIEVDEVRYDPGSDVTGRVVVEEATDRVRGITVELAKRDSSRRSRTTGFDVVASVKLDEPGHKPVPFALAVPATALPGFRGRYGKVEWLVRGSADVRGIDPTATANFEVNAPTEPTVAASQQEIPAHLQERALRPSRPSGQWIETLMLLGLFCFGIYMTGLALHRYFTDNGGNGALGFSVITLGLAAVMGWLLLHRFPPKLRGVNVEPAAVVISGGHEVRAAVTVTRSDLTIGLQGVERYAEDRKSEHGRNVVYPEHIFHEEWTTIDKGTTEVAFEIPSDALPSYSGKAVLIDWRLVVIRRKHRKRKTASRHVTRLLLVH